MASQPYTYILTPVHPAVVMYGLLKVYAYANEINIIKFDLKRKRCEREAYSLSPHNECYTCRQYNCRESFGRKVKNMCKGSPFLGGLQLEL